MKPDRFVGLTVGEVGIEKESGKYVVVTNCICTLPHDTPEKYQNSHGEGCLMVPYEGLVVAVDSGGKVVTWKMEDIRQRVLDRISKVDGDEIKKQIDAILEAEEKAAKREKAKNLRYG